MCFDLPRLRSVTGLFIERSRIAVGERSRTVRDSKGVEVDKICEVCEVVRE